MRASGNTFVRILTISIAPGRMSLLSLHPTCKDCFGEILMILLVVEFFRCNKQKELRCTVALLFCGMSQCV